MASLFQKPARSSPLSLAKDNCLLLLISNLHTHIPPNTNWQGKFLVSRNCWKPSTVTLLTAVFNHCSLRQNWHCLPVNPITGEGHGSGGMKQHRASIRRGHDNLTSTLPGSESTTGTLCCYYDVLTRTNV